MHETKVKRDEIEKNKQQHIHTYKQDTIARWNSTQIQCSNKLQLIWNRNFLKLQINAEVNGAAAKIQALQRGKAARKELKEKQDAAVKIQAIQRGKADREKVKKMKEENGGN